MIEKGETEQWENKCIQDGELEFWSLYSTPISIPPPSRILKITTVAESLYRCGLNLETTKEEDEDKKQEKINAFQAGDSLFIKYQPTLC